MQPIAEWVGPWGYFLWKCFWMFWCVLMVSEALQSYSSSCYLSQFEHVWTYLWSPKPWTKPTLKSENQTGLNLNLRFGSSIWGSNQGSGPNFSIPSGGLRHFSWTCKTFSLWVFHVSTLTTMFPLCIPVWQMLTELISGEDYTNKSNIIPGNDSQPVLLL